MIDGFVRVWLTFSLMVFGAAFFAAVWAARAGLFRHRERARNLPLWAHVEEEPGESSPSQGTGASRGDEGGSQRSKE